MNPDGSGVLDITNNPANDFDPTWAPYGEWIAFVSDRDRNLEIYATNDRFLLKRLTQNSGVDAFPAYSPDGTQIASRPTGEMPGTSICTPWARRATSSASPS